MKICNNIKKYRKFYKITQKELAEKIKITERQMINIEAGEDTKISTAFKIKKELQVNNLEELFFIDKD